MKSASTELKKAMEYNSGFYQEAHIVFSDGRERELPAKDFYISGNSYSDGAGTSSFPLGVAMAKQLTVCLVNDDDRFSDYDFYMAKITSWCVYDLGERKEKILLGTFTVTTPESYGTQVTVNAIDDMYLGDTDYSTTLSYPLSAGSALRDSCSTCGVTLLDTTFENDDFIIEKIPENITHRMLWGMCAMLSGGNARMDERNRLMIVGYDLSFFQRKVLDGGVFDGSTPYSTGDSADGGSFHPWSTGDIVDGGDFGELNRIHFFHRIKTPHIDTDDVVITGIQTTVDENTFLFGGEGYVLKVENQLISGNPQEGVERIGPLVVGLRFRPFSAEHTAYPLADFGDICYISDLKGNVYNSVITDINFTFYGFTTIKCSADSPVRNSSRYNSQSVSAIVEARRNTRKQITEYDKAVQSLTSLITQSFGVFKTEEVLEDGSTIYYMHDRPTLPASRTIWKMTADAFAVSTDGGKTWNAGMDSEGNELVNVLSAIGINAYWINTGSLTVKKGDKTTFFADVDTGRVDIVADSFSLSSGQTIDSIAQNKLENFVSAVYDPEIASLQAQIDGQIETWYYDYEPTLSNAPASGWKTETERAKHEGDLFYWKSKGYSYRFFKDATTWKWQLITDSDITKALSDASKAQDTADNKRRVFVTTPVPPYDVGDLWFNGSGSDIMTCMTARSSGSYASSDWQKRNKYIDQSAANTAASNAVNAQTQTDIFNKLTNNGTLQGVYMQGGQLYINASYIKSGTMVLGGANNGNGTLSVRNSSGVEIGAWNNGGINVNGGSIKIKGANTGLSIQSGAMYASWNDENVGLVGANYLGNSDNTGMAFDVDYGKFMLWAAKDSAGASSYTTKMAYMSKDKNISGYEAGAMNFYCDVNMHNYSIKDAGIKSALTIYSDTACDVYTNVDMHNWTLNNVVLGGNSRVAKLTVNSDGSFTSFSQIVGHNGLYLWDGGLTVREGEVKAWNGCDISVGGTNSAITINGSSSFDIYSNINMHNYTVDNIKFDNIPSISTVSGYSTYSGTFTVGGKTITVKSGIITDVS